MPIRDLDPDNDYAYDRTNQSAPDYDDEPRRTPKKAKPQPTAEQLAALRTYAAHEGRYWKQALNDCWMTGYYPVFTQRAEIDGLLQQVRNQFGPSWLNRFTLQPTSDECPKCSRIGAGPLCKAHKETE